MKMSLLLTTACRAFAALSAAAVLTPVPAHAATPADGPSAAVSTPVVFRTDAALFTPERDFRYQTDGISSSNDALEAERLSLAGESGEGAGYQPPPGRRRSYGRSRYEDRLHNSDGSTKIAIMAGGGMNLPVGNTGKFYTPSYDIAGGVGFNFNKMLGVLGEVHYDHAGVTGGAIAYEYANLQQYYQASASDLAGFDANAHVLSITANPVLSFSNDSSKLGVYLTGGVGYYRKTTNFTLPSYGTACDYFCYTYATNYNVDTASSNGFGANGGFGFTYRISEFSNERLFVEARYHWINIDSKNNTDLFPFNKRNTEYVPVLVGVRF